MNPDHYLEAERLAAEALHGWKNNMAPEAVAALAAIAQVHATLAGVDSAPAKSDSPTEGLITLAEAAEILDCHQLTIRRRIADGSIKAYRMGPRAIRVDAAEVRAFAKAVPTARETQRP